MNSAAAAELLAEATAAMSLSAVEHAKHVDQWRAAIRAALADGMDAQTVGVLAGGLSPSRVYQIRDGRRTGPTPTTEGTP